MSRLVYPDNVASEIRYKVGKVRQVTVYYPMGPRCAPVDEKIVISKATFQRRKKIADLVVDYIKTHDPKDKGVTIWDLMVAVPYPQDSIRRCLNDAPSFFRREETPEFKEFERNGRTVTTVLYRYHLVTPATKEGEHGDTNQKRSS